MFYFCNKLTLSGNKALLKGLERVRLARAHCILSSFDIYTLHYIIFKKIFFFVINNYANKYMIKRMQLIPRPETDSSCNILFPYFYMR